MEVPRRLRVSGTDGYVDALGAGARSISLTYEGKIHISHDDTSRQLWYSIGASEKASDFLKETQNTWGGVAMESIALTIKFVAMVAFEVFAIAVVGAALIAGLYQLARDQVRGIVDQVRGRRAPTPAMARKGQ
jgi:hypothetical protein